MGGDDFDSILTEYIEKELNINLDLEKKHQLYLYAKDIKTMLSHNSEVKINLKKFGLDDKEILLTREKFNMLIDTLVKETLKISKEVLFDSGLNINELDEIILVGGSTRIPYIKFMVENFFNKKPLSNINPDNVVAIGASIQANILSGNSSDELLLLDVIPLSLGVETMGELVEVIIPRNITIPTSSSKEYTTFKDGQNAMSIHVVQGERDLVSDCRSLAKFIVKDIPPMLAGTARSQVRFSNRRRRNFSVSATEMTTKNITSIEVKPSYGIDDSEIEKMLKDSIDNAEDDINNRNLNEAVVEGKRVSFQLIPH